MSDVFCVCQNEADAGPVREIDLSTFDERSSHQRQHLPVACSAGHSRTEMTNGTTDNGMHVLTWLLWNKFVCFVRQDVSDFACEKSLFQFHIPDIFLFFS